MKHAPITLLIVLIPMVMSCNDASRDMVYSYIFYDKELYDNGERFETPRDVGYWIYSNISYDSNEYNSWYVQDPKETLDKGTGDCKAAAVLFLNLYYFSSGYRGEIVLVKQNTMSRSIELGGAVDHCMVEINGVIYEPQTGEQFTGEVRYRYKFKEIFE